VNILDRSLVVFGASLLACGFIVLFRGPESPGAAITVLGFALAGHGGIMIGLFLKRRASHR